MASRNGPKEFLQGIEGPTSTSPNQQSGSPVRPRLTIVRWTTRKHRTLTVLFYLALSVGLYFYLRSLDWGEISQIRFNGWWLLAACVLGLGVRLWQVEIWVTALRNLGARDVVINARLVLIYAKSWLGRYIPGTAPWILGKIYFASRHGISTAKLAVGSIIEAGTQVAVLIVISAAALSMDARLRVNGPEFMIAALILGLLCIVVLTPAVFNRVMTFLARRVARRANQPAVQVDLRTILVASSQYAVAALFGGLALFCLVKSVHPGVQSSDLMFVVSAACVAGAASMVAILAPAGLGVRESVLLVLLAVIVPPAVAAVLVIAARLWEVALDLLFVLGARVAEAIWSTPTSPANSE